MSDIKFFLRVLEKEGYPNPNLVSLANFVDYDLNDFLLDLNDLYNNNEEKVVEFTKRAIDKISTPDGIKVDLWEEDEYVWIKLNPIGFDSDEEENSVLCQHTWGPSRVRIYDEEGLPSGFKSIQEMINDVDFSDYSDLDELLDSLRRKVYEKIYTTCGFGIFWT